jgi:hypothetical protein
MLREFGQILEDLSSDHPLQVVRELGQFFGDQAHVLSEDGQLGWENG